MLWWLTFKLPYTVLLPQPLLQLQPLFLIPFLAQWWGSDPNAPIKGNDRFDVITTEWEGGRTGIIAGDHNWHGNFETYVHYESGAVHLPIYKDEKPFYACLLEQVIPFFETGRSPIDKEETLAVMEFVEYASGLRSRI